MDLLCRVRNSTMYVLSWRTVSATTRVLFWYLFPWLLHNTENKHRNKPLVSSETVRHSSTYIILYICRYRDDHVGSYITVMSHEHHNISIHWQINCLCNSLLEMNKNNKKLLITVLFVRAIEWWQVVDSPHKGPVMPKVFPCHDVSCIYKYTYIMGLIQYGFQHNSVRKKKWWECCCKHFIC